MVTAYWTSQAVHAAAILGIADAMRDGPRTLEEVAGVTGTHGPMLYRLLRALAALGLFEEDADGRFGVTSLGDYLRSDHPQSIRAWAIALNEPWFHRAWEGLPDAVRTGRVAFDQAGHHPTHLSAGHGIRHAPPAHRAGGAAGQRLRLEQVQRP
ncbi:MAG: hypothetical protein LC797_24180 [Chloroflexi bacterium]|nr:hypothetical protein [Chloroflexota bacterium]